MNRVFHFLTVLLTASLLAGCTAFNVNILTTERKALREVTLEGSGPGKVLVIPIYGTITLADRKGLVNRRPGTVPEVVARLAKAEKDSHVKAVILKIDSPGGTVTASDTLYQEIMRFKQRTGTKIVAAMMGMATSGGYYVSLPADFIMAHPTTVTGSVGVVFLQPKAFGLMEKIGLQMEVSKSGKDKDMGSPFRRNTAGERRIFQNLTESLADRFLQLVAQHRHVDKQALARISSARIYLAGEARDLGLVDGIGYLPDAVSRAKQLAGLDPDSRVVVYRRRKRPNDNVYDNAEARYDGQPAEALELNLSSLLPVSRAGFYYLWLPLMNDN